MVFFVILSSTYYFRHAWPKAEHSSLKLVVLYAIKNWILEPMVQGWRSFGRFKDDVVLNGLRMTLFWKV